MEKRRFYIYQEDLIRIKVDDIPRSISEIVMQINAGYCQEGMKRLRTECITDYLLKRGYLVKDEMNNKIKRPTSKGKLLGIIVEKRINENGASFGVNVYNKRAQQYILDNIYEMI